MGTGLSQEECLSLYKINLDALRRPGEKIVENVNNNIHSVVIEDGITEIGDYTFCYTGNLEEITIPNSVTSIGIGAFEGCSGLKKITIPDSVTSIERGAFMGCSDNLEIIYNGSAEGYPWKTNISER